MLPSLLRHLEFISSHHAGCHRDLRSAINRHFNLGHATFDGNIHRCLANGIAGREADDRAVRYGIAGAIVNRICFDEEPSLGAACLDSQIAGVGSHLLHHANFVGMAYACAEFCRALFFAAVRRTHATPFSDGRDAETSFPSFGMTLKVTASGFNTRFWKLSWTMASAVIPFDVPTGTRDGCTRKLNLLAAAGVTKKFAALQPSEAHRIAT